MKKTLILALKLINLLIALYLVATLAAGSGPRSKMKASYPHCNGCRIPKSQRYLFSNNVQNTCSGETNLRGDGQRVISFSYYNLDPRETISSRYFAGIEENVKLVRELYPGYVMRLYTNATTGQSYDMLCQIYCQYNELDICDVQNLGFYGDISKSFGMVWRFAPMADPLVVEWHSRDLDSRITEREVTTVIDWHENHQKKSFHIMRDSPQHDTHILGGMFGMKMDRISIRKASREIFELILTNSVNIWRKGKDQQLLSKLLWPRIGSNLVQYDSYFCTKYKVNSTPFPTKRLSGDGDFTIGVKNNFVGAQSGEILALDKSFKRKKTRPKGACPRECRPRGHEDWLLC